MKIFDHKIEKVILKANEYLKTCMMYRENGMDGKENKDISKETV